MRLIIAGGAGFIGSCFVRKVLDGQFPEFTDLLVIDKLTYSGNTNNFGKYSIKDFEFIEGDICDRELLLKFIKSQDIIINFAAESHVDRSIQNATKFVISNVLGFQTLLEVSRTKNVKMLIQVSTDEVYGSILEGSWTEFSPLLPNSPYAASKASADLFARAYHQTYDIDVRITRCGNNYGPYQFPEKLIPLAITNLLQSKSVPIYGSGNNVRDWIHVDDHCKAIYSIIKLGSAGEVYNIGPGTKLTNLELIDKILGYMGKTQKNLEFVSDRLGHDLRYSLNSTHLNKTQNFLPEIDFDVGLKSTIEWYQENRNWWSNLVNSIE